MSRNELLDALHLKDRKSLRDVYILPALNDHLIKMTQPDSPRSTYQKYRLTEKGKALLNNG